jgi:methionyl-tRNA formyltransferase
MRTVFFGTRQFAAVILQALAQSAHQVLAVVTQPDRPAGRGLRLRESPVKARARDLGLRVETPDEPNSAAFVRLAESLEPELFAVAAYGHILRPSLLAVSSIGCVNVHASLLPRYRGAAPVHHALINGDVETGITTIWMDERMDAGDMILQRALPIAPQDDAGALEDQLARLGAEVLLETLRLIEQGAAPRIKQDEAQATYAPPITRAGAQIDWRASAQQVCNLVRGANPTPGAYTFHRGRRLKVLQALASVWPPPAGGGPPAAEIAPGAAGNPGEVVESGPTRVVVVAGVGAVALLQVKPEGGRAMTAAEYARGHQLRSGEALGSVPGQ